MPKRPLFYLLLLAVAMLGAVCPPKPQNVKVLQPIGPVTTFSFVVEVNVPSSVQAFDPNTGVTLNGAPLVVSGGPTVYSATVNAGFPLQDANLVSVEAVLSNGQVGTASRPFDYLPPKATARKITDPGDLMTGPLAHDLYSVGQFGGNLIDAELVSAPGTDNFLEVQPMLNVETVINATSVQIVNTGQDGTPAIVRTCGPDDLLDFANPSSFLVDAGIAVPPDIDDNDQLVTACTEYTLAPGDPYVRMDTTVESTDTVALNMAVGDWMNAAGQLEQWDKPFQLGESLLGSLDLIGFIGYDEAEGVDYGYTTLPVDPPQAGAQPTNFFTTSGVSIILQNASVLGTLFGTPPPFIVPAGGSLTFTRFLSVGDGSGANATQMEAEVKGLATTTVEGCVTVGGTPLPGSRVSVVTLDGSMNPQFMIAQYVTRPGACPNYGSSLPAGSYSFAAGREGALFEGGLPSPSFDTLTLTAGVPVTGLDFELPAPGQLNVTVTDESGSAGLPARVTVVGIDPSPPQTIAGPGFPGLGGSTVALFYDPKDLVPHGLVAFEYTDAAGLASFDVEPGSYQVFVSRGTEYSLFETAVTVTSGSPTAVAAQIGRVLDTSNFVSSDFHIHGVASADSRVSDTRRVFQLAGEGIENPVMTDHHVHTDLKPTIAALGLGAFITSTIGEEITTFDYGHFNGYPFTIDPSLPSGGSTDWGVAAPAGFDFPSAGAFNATPPEIFTLATTQPTSTADTTVQINHIDSHFAPTQIDTGVAGPIEDDLDDAERLQRRLDTEANVGNLFFPFPAIEIWNGMNRAHQSEFLDQRIGIWMNLLNKGIPTTYIADTDTHQYTNLRTAGARTWTASSTDDPALIDGGEVANAVDAGRATGGQGIYVQTRLLAQDGSGGIADLTSNPGASTTVASSNGDVDLEIRVQAPTWAQFDTIEIYANATTTVVDPLEPYLYTATPTLTLKEGDCNPATTGDGDFDINVVNVHAIPGGDRQETTLTVSFPGLAADTWFVAVVKGTDGVCGPMFPVYASDLATTNTTLPDLLDGNVGEDGTMALGATNALWADVDGTPGFQPPNP
jgi:hypothetical protein